MRAPCGVLPGRGCRCVRTAGFGVPVSAGARNLWTFRLWRCLVADPAEDAARRAYGPDWDLEYSGHLLAATQAAREALAPIRALHRRVPVLVHTDDCTEHDPDQWHAEVACGEAVCWKCDPVFWTCTHCADLVDEGLGGERPEWPCDTARLIYSTTELEEGSTS